MAQGPETSGGEQVGQVELYVQVGSVMQPVGPGGVGFPTAPAIETFANGTQVAVAAAAASILAANANRKVAHVQNIGAQPIRVGLTGVTASTGIVRLEAGDMVHLNSTQQLFAIRDTAAVADSTVLVSEST